MDPTASKPSDDASVSGVDRLENLKPALPSSQTPPPYWQHRRSISHASQISVDRPRPITLRDRTESLSSTNGALWAKSISIEDYVVVSGNVTGIGAYVVWTCKVQTLDGGPLIIRKRYSEFYDLREKLAAAFPQSKPALPALPPKSIIYRFQQKFLEKRRSGLSYFLTCVMLNPVFAGSAIIKDFIFA